MPTLKVNGADIHYDVHGDGPETIVFAHGLLWSGQMFTQQVAHFQGRYRCITFDFRGQGQSAVTESGYDMDTLTEDTAALIENLDCGPCHFAGLSMGGFVGMRLALRRPDLIQSLILLETTSDPEPQENQGKYRLLTFIGRWFGLGPVANRIMKIMFGQSFLNDPNRLAERELWRRRLVSNHRVGISRAVYGVIDRQGVYDEIHQIKVPTLIAVGDQDVATVLRKSERMHERIPGSELVIIPEAGHSSSIEQPEAVNQAIEQFLNTV